MRYLDILKTVAKILVSLDDKLLARVDRAARKAGISRSAYLSRIAARELERGPGIDERVSRAIKDLDELFRTHPHDEDSTAAVRAARDSR